MLSDLPRSHNVKTLSYADDITLVTTSNSVEAAQQKMQNYLNVQSSWLAKW
jgi:hypothetical protein